MWGGGEQIGGMGDRSSRKCAEEGRSYRVGDNGRKPETLGTRPKQQCQRMANSLMLIILLFTVLCTQK